jgi:predicted ArsR family transcriptional regulator
MGGYRRTDPDTCRRAFEQIVEDGTLSERRREVVGQLSAGAQLTAGEIATAIRRNRNNVATRLTELEYLDVVEKVEEKPCPISGKTCWSWGMTGRKPSGKVPKRRSQVALLLDFVEEIAQWAENAGLKKLARRIRERVAEIERG